MCTNRWRSDEGPRSATLPDGHWEQRCSKTPNPLVDLMCWFPSEATGRSLRCDPATPHLRPQAHSSLSVLLQNKLGALMFLQVFFFVFYSFKRVKKKSLYHCYIVNTLLSHCHYNYLGKKTSEISQQKEGRTLSSLFHCHYKLYITTVQLFF